MKPCHASRHGHGGAQLRWTWKTRSIFENLKIPSFVEIAVVDRNYVNVWQIFKSHFLVRTSITLDLVYFQVSGFKNGHCGRSERGRFLWHFLATGKSQRDFSSKNWIRHVKSKPTSLNNHAKQSFKKSGTKFSYFFCYQIWTYTFLIIYKPIKLSIVL